MPEDWKTIEMKELFTDEEIKEITKLLNKKDYDALRKFLREREKKLAEKGILPDYLFYYLQFVAEQKLKKVV